MIHFHPQIKSPGPLDYLLCVFAVAIVAFGAGLLLRAIYNSI
jgi:hypothetical protein